MTRNALRTFVAVVESGSMHAASNSLHLSQSAISRQILQLEQELETTLLERQPRGVRLTSAGEIFIRYARDALAEADRVRSEISALHGLQRGTIRVAAAEAFMTMVLPDCIATFRAQYPGVNILVKLGTTNGVVASVRDGQADFGIAYDPQLEPEMEVSYSVRQRMTAVMAPGHPLSGRKALGLADLVDVPLALPPIGSATGALIYRAARHAGLVLRPALETNSVQMRLSIALNADLVALLVHISAVDLVRKAELVAIPMRDRMLNEGAIAMFSLRGRRLSNAAESFRHLVHHELQSVRFRAQVSGGMP